MWLLFRHSITAYLWIRTPAVGLLAAKKLRLTEVPVHIAENLTPAQVKAYRLMDNRSHEETDWDIELLGHTRD